VERTIVVTGIPFGADEKILFKHFSKCGLIEAGRHPKKSWDNHGMIMG
jgi:RNA recognition motif-containing protein